MNDRAAQALWPNDAVDAAELAAIRIDRARIELRHGRPVMLRDSAHPGTSWLAAAVETLDEARLLRLRRLGGAPLHLVLTAERLQALGCGRERAAGRLELPEATTLATLQALAAVTPEPVARGDVGPAAPADAALRAALVLAKRARLTPALVAVRWPEGADPGPWLAIDAADVEHLVPVPPALRRVSDAHVPIAAHEDCTLILFREIEGDVEHLAIVVGQPAPQQPVAVRLHSSCLTGDLLGSLRCDCGDQLRRAIDHLAVDGGVLLYLSQEGRGTGLANKLRAYRLQDGGLDTLQADRHLGFRDDERDFRVAAAMLHALAIDRIHLLTNNPHKIEALRAAGIDVVDRVPLPAPVTAHNARYLRTKRDHAGHHLQAGVDDDDPLDPPPTRGA